MNLKALNRRQFLRASGAVGCCAAASPLVAPVALASAPWDQRLVVIVLRGGMDGLDVLRPHGDPDLVRLRQRWLAPDAQAGMRDLDGFFGLHPALDGLWSLWQAGELGFAHAVSTPYRDKRSHFDGQDLLEAGASHRPNGTVPRDGWLNRMLQQVPGLQAETAFSIGQENMLLLRGAADVSNWAPDAGFRLSSQGQRLLQAVYEEDDAFHEALEEAIALMSEIEADEAAEAPDDNMMAMSEMMAASKNNRRNLDMVEFLVGRLRRETRIAAFSIAGWDTHRNQTMLLSRALGQLSETIMALRVGLGPLWSKTAVVAMTEFGRTARENGTRGTDHGTGGAMLFAGGAIRGGRVHGSWPGLGEDALYAGRDLMPTADVRSYAAAVMREHLGFSRSVLEQTVFPGLDMGEIRGLIA
ncbi:DUF1501 domain-containing protein [Tropicimonas sp. TH_r6]|uniref:DUF1501 domain-containing protein n=1 Tax=Tropicimonas sp. TH_r6 TaxID=3082085 RepID=UPI0029559A16|nr:DUF1501 domain-containing protein [Tropicimonas sp. TH_r6]MDV7145477.1 DUF1501 domain-containing protein [Tropicimonas sp. TH_r6]